MPTSAAEPHRAAARTEGEDVDRYGLPTHWYQPFFSTAVHGLAGNAASDETSAGGAAADVAGDAAGDETYCIRARLCGRGKEGGNPNNLHTALLSNEEREKEAQKWLLFACLGGVRRRSNFGDGVFGVVENERLKASTVASATDLPTEDLPTERPRPCPPPAPRPPVRPPVTARSAEARSAGLEAPPAPSALPPPFPAVIRGPAAAAAPPRFTAAAGAAAAREGPACFDVAWHSLCQGAPFTL
eukprot:scaffold26550_cov47-Phaeocystis_antarctica.AAC.3